MPLAFGWLWFGGLMGLIYVIALLSAGVMTIRNGRIGLFVIGLFFPILWIFGAVMNPRTRY